MEHFSATMRKAGGLLTLWFLLLLTLTGCHSHSWTEATCTAPKTCSNCKETEGEALGHTWVEATCTAPKTCSRCKETEGEALGHTWADATCEVPLTCTVCNETAGSPLGHRWIEGNCTTETVCSECGKVEAPAPGHQFTEATCTEPRICLVCNETEGEPLGHQWLAATCKLARTCSVCHETEGEPLGHQWVEATCQQLKTCSVCGKRVGTKGDHVPGEWITIKAATKEETGMRGLQCSLCNIVIDLVPVWYARHLTDYSANQLGEQIVEVCKKDGPLIFDVDPSQFAYYILDIDKKIGVTITYQGEDVMVAGCVTMENGHEFIGPDKVDLENYLDGLYIVLPKAENSQAVLASLVAVMEVVDPDLFVLSAVQLLLDVFEQEERIVKNEVAYTYTVDSGYETIEIQLAKSEADTKVFRNVKKAGTYKIGTDMSAGEYVVFAENGTGYFCISSDSNQNDIIDNDNFSYNSIIKVKNGDYLKLSRAYAVPIEDVDSLDTTQTGSMFKVGTFLDPGEYKLKATSSNGYYAVHDEKNGYLDHIVDNDIFDGYTYVTVKRGQYLILSRAVIVSKV